MSKFVSIEDFRKMSEEEKDKALEVEGQVKHLNEELREEARKEYIKEMEKRGIDPKLGQYVFAFPDDIERELNFIDDKELFFEKLFINSELKNDICKDMDLTGEEYTEYSQRLDRERRCEIEEIKRVRSLYHNKKSLEEFEFPDFKSFCNWHKNQYEHQEGKCYYCGVEEKVVAKFFEKKYHAGHAGKRNRGKHLEIERKDATTNLYNKENCVLACYFCNNDKSDIFSEDEYREYLKNRKRFFNTQIEKTE
jgi:5-methylcytosine-specific restriction endonuclease McrA